ncbi:LysM domain-containing protein [Streptomyces sp. NPDC050703]|uniref:LysM peptidoglycan-binding domain-containing protein n=1 Tax=Streptomyces sp. NPDC050703 TaxID=3157218 RepID=UPI003436A72F
MRQRIAARLAQRSHTVRPGEHLASIGAMYGVRWPDIARANGLTSPYRVYPGRVLKIPEK